MCINSPMRAGSGGFLIYPAPACIRPGTEGERMAAVVPADEQTVREWAGIAAVAGPSVMARVAEFVAAHQHDLADEFYGALTAMPESAPFLDHSVVHERLHASMRRWLTGMFCSAGGDTAAVIARQRHVGDVHARIRIPIHLVLRGLHVLRRAVVAGVLRGGTPPPEAIAVLRYVTALFDLAAEAMSQAYESSLKRNSKVEEAFRLHSLTRDVSTEREHQRAALLEWTKAVLFRLHSVSGGQPLPGLGASEFGLWLAHKATVMFEGDDDLIAVRNAVRRLDEELVPRLAALSGADPRYGAAVTEVEHEIGRLEFHLIAMFDRHMAREPGRDELTQLLSDRFLPAVLTHEIDTHREQGLALSLVAVAVDGMEAIRTRSGRQGSDDVLLQVSRIVSDSVRGGDWVFRVHGDSLLVVLVEAGRPVAERVAESIRTRVEALHMRRGDTDSAGVTVSAGVAVFDGHPDPWYLIRGAEAALARAQDDSAPAPPRE